MNNFEKWWYNVGSGIRPEQGEDIETFAHRISKLAVESVLSEAPTDKEILKAFPKLDPTQSYANTQNRGIRYGAKWMRKILMGK